MPSANKSHFKGYCHLMRIFQVIEASAHHAIPSNQTWYRNLYEFSAEEGSRALRQKDKEASAIFSQKMMDTFHRKNAKKPFDLFFSYLIDGMVDPIVIDKIRKMGIPTCNFSCNNTHQFDLITILASHFDYNLHAERINSAKLARMQFGGRWLRIQNTSGHMIYHVISSYHLLVQIMR
jgi:hypothetical protein